MKYLLTAFFLFLCFAGCSKKEEPKLQAYNAEAYAYDIGGAWEVNASTRVKGFKQKEQNKKYFVSLSYDIDIITPGGDTLKSLITRVEDKDSQEELTDIPLEVQFNLDSTYTPGKYVLVFHINDPETGGKASSAAGFEL